MQHDAPISIYFVSNNVILCLSSQQAYYGRREGPGSISDFAFVIVIPKAGGSNRGQKCILFSDLCAWFEGYL